MTSLLEVLAGAIEDSKKGGGMVIEQIQEADKLISRGQLKARKEFLEALVRAEEAGQCPWCGVDLKLWLLEAREEHAKDAVCNSKEQESLDLIIDLAENYDRGDGPADTPDARKVLNLIARIVLS